ncbi:Imidazoleglycerol-phosphate dehydratase [Caldicellulosiruptor saccharolyticus DSM 8903]|uniref:Imidazoleglycerol-phosphate dehydratase n=1 Tax=Caldicellulosiruptor saccharolyticus (strain ATCC 43494 / DSM 8903 / Tp8T 6331) TaxID=351627 RepID=HIS7_CALS8|nr:imidazoleglycerol-phosphate dehydratase HisB [Caldicellulosiruptor saccharolyticus]A4XL23.1 RecName: Full=Imidazoleglycerol-phosphate dehydratase; Short=IGPD [Caldicellulosiruptor saccharolyticus DSM 8903]ABP67608.1 Imidazoleglycerol-phosphate dehydratase [Caldicellulosiruptor saccharolyticus DSM 8903]
MNARIAEVQRKTKETEIKMVLNIDGDGEYKISTGIGFFDHMLQLFCHHGKFNIQVEAKGDLHIDDHHTIEDVGIVLGQAFLKAISDKRGIKRYSHIILPMDEALIMVAIDISGRPYLAFDVDFRLPKLGEMNSQMVVEFFRAFVSSAKVTLHVKKISGENDHHVCEAIFKAFGRVLKDACTIVDDKIPSSKGVL